MRSSTSAVLGALAAVAGWVAWSMLGDSTSAASAVPAATELAVVAPAPAPRDPPSVAVARVVSPPASAAAVAPRAPTLRDGLVMEHGLPTAVHVAAGDGTQGHAPPAMALPTGAHAEDTVVNPAGMVALTRSAEAPAAADASAADAVRPATATRAP